MRKIMSFSSFVWTILVGSIVGALSKFLMLKTDLGGVAYAMVLGFGGAFLVGIFGPRLGWYREGEPLGFIASSAGAVIVLMLFQVFSSLSSREIA
jgi:uncharacterized membrane protein YeaQ/YmgE (transglycosylase-associated protein family)